jgi:hypothetical protein
MLRNNSNPIPQKRIPVKTEQPKTSLKTTRMAPVLKFPKDYPKCFY